MLLITRKNQGTNIQKNVMRVYDYLKMFNFLFIRKLAFVNSQFYQIYAVIMRLENLKSPIRNTNCII